MKLWQTKTPDEMLADLSAMVESVTRRPVPEFTLLDLDTYNVLVGHRRGDRRARHAARMARKQRRGWA